MIAKKLSSVSIADLGNLVKYMLGLSKGEHEAEKVDVIFNSMMVPDPITTDAEGNILSIYPDEIIQEMTNLASKHRNASDPKFKPFDHFTASLNPGVTLSVYQWREITKALASRIGCDSVLHQILAIRHRDVQHEHTHIALNRVYENELGHYKMSNNSMDYERAMEVMRHYEREYGLQIVANPSKSDSINLTQGEMNFGKREGRKPLRQDMWERISVAINYANGQGKTWKDFVSRCEQQGMTVRTKYEVNKDTGIDEPKGVVFGFRGTTRSGRSIKGARCTFPRLVGQEGIKYDHERDYEFSLDANARFDAKNYSGKQELSAGSNRDFKPKMYKAYVKVTASERGRLKSLNKTGRISRGVTGSGHHIAEFNFSIPSSTYAALLAERDALAKWAVDIMRRHDQAGSEAMRELILLMLAQYFGRRNVRVRECDELSGHINQLKLGDFLEGVAHKSKEEELPVLA